MTSLVLSFLGSYWWLYLIGVGLIAAVGCAFAFAPTLMALPIAREVAGGALVLAFGCFLYAHVVRVAYQEGYDAATAAVRAKTDAEVKQAQAVADYWQRYAQGLLAQIKAVGQDNDKLQGELDKILADQAVVVCLPQSVIDELRSVKGIRHGR